ncbi:hypothetical protein A5884_001333, partial [Enterococcus sp. 7D2_DIV0200]
KYSKIINFSFSYLNNSNNSLYFKVQ